MTVSPELAPTREQGYAGPTSVTGSWWRLDETEQVPELRWPDSIRTYDRMRRSDPQVISTLRAVTLPILRTQWRIHAAGADPEVTAFVARELGLPVAGEQDSTVGGRTRDRFSWRQHLRLALLSLPFGHMAFEQVYRVEFHDGRWWAHLRKLGPRMPATIKKWNVAADGGLVSIEQHTRGSDQRERAIPVKRLVVYTCDLEGTNWTGHSILRGAYKPWILKDRVLRVDVMSIDRNGLGIPVYEGAEGETDLTAGKKLASEVRAGADAGAAIPNTAKLSLKGVEGQLPDALARVRYYDSQIAAAVLAHFLNLGQQRGTGSWALGSTFANFFEQSLESVAQDVEDVANAHIVEDLVDLNFGPDVAAPRLVHDPIGSRTADIARSLQLLIDSGVITTDPTLERYIREALDLPAPDAPDTQEDTTDGP